VSTGGFAPPARETSGWAPQPGANAAARTSIPAVDVPVARVGWDAPPVEETVHRTRAPEAPEALPEEPEEEKSPWATVALVAGAVVLVAAIVIGGFALRGGGGAEPEANETATVAGDPPPAPGLGYVPPVRDLKGKAQGDEAVFTWKPPKTQEEGDEYGYRVLSLTSESRYERATGTSATVPRAESGETCIEVVVMRSGKASAQPQPACVPAG
jgi:hypothetical protein